MKRDDRPSETPFGKDLRNLVLKHRNNGVEPDDVLVCLIFAAVSMAIAMDCVGRDGTAFAEKLFKESMRHSKDNQKETVARAMKAMKKNST